MSNQSKKLGYIGLGNAGYPLASTLARAGYLLVVRDVDNSRAVRFASEHANAEAAVDSPEAFKEVDNVDSSMSNFDIKSY